MAEVDDDLLLDALAVALRPHASLEPRPAEVAAFRSLVSTSGAATGTSRARRLRRWAAGLLAGGVVLSGGTAYATSGSAPRPVRSAAFALRLPVEAPELTDAKEALDALVAELREGRADQVAAAVADVEEELADLTPAARRQLEPRASSLVATALAFLADAADVSGHEDGRESDDSGSKGSGSNDSESDDSGSDDSGAGQSTDDDAGDDRSGSDSGGGGSSGSDSDDSGDSSGSRGSGSDGGSEPDEPSSGDDSPNRGSGSSGSGSGSDDDAGVSASGAERDLDDLDDIGHLGD